MEVILKTFHYFSILFAGAVTFRGVVTQAAYMEAGDTPTLHIGKVFAEIDHIGLGSIVTLWVIVVGLSHLIYYSLAINGAIYVKLLGAAIVLFISAYANLHVYQAIKAKRAPGPGQSGSPRQRPLLSPHHAVLDRLARTRTPDQ